MPETCDNVMKTTQDVVVSVRDPALLLRALRVQDHHRGQDSLPDQHQLPLPPPLGILRPW